MSPHQTCCPGCNGVFTASGYSQHISKMPDIRCRLVLQALHMSTASQFIPDAASSLASNTLAGPTSQALHCTSVDEMGDATQISILNEMPALFADTEPTTTHASHEGKFLSTHEIEHSLIKANTPDNKDSDPDNKDSDPDDPADMTDAIDANTFETLHLAHDGTASVVSEMPCMPPPEDLVPLPEDLDLPPEDLVPLPEDLALPSTESEVNTTKDMPLVTTPIIDRFPNGSTGAPISGAHGGSSTEDTGSKGLQGSTWAPFSSQCNWEIACWDKMHGPSSSAFSELLVIPEV